MTLTLETTQSPFACWHVAIPTSKPGYSDTFYVLTADPDSRGSRWTFYAPHLTYRDTPEARIEVLSYLVCHLNANMSVLEEVDHQLDASPEHTLLEAVTALKQDKTLSFILFSALDKIAKRIGGRFHSAESAVNPVKFWKWIDDEVLPQVHPFSKERRLEIMKEGSVFGMVDTESEEQEPGDK